jgi:hypothetical protein
MADLNRLYDALKQADAAGNKEDAQQLADWIRSEQAAQPQAQEQQLIKPEETSFGQRALSSLKQGFQSFGEASEGREVARLKDEGKLPEAAAKMADIKANAAKPQAPTLSPADIRRIAHEKGYLPAGMELPSFVVEQVLKSAPEMAESIIAGYAAGALTTAGLAFTPAAPAAPIVGPIVGTLTGIGTYAYQTYGHSMNTQALVKQAPEELDPASARKWAAITAPVGFIVDKLTFGVGKFGKKAVADAVVEELAKRTTGQVIKETVKAGSKEAAKRAAIGVSEMPTEMLEQWAELHQAGIPTDTEEAKQQIWDAGWSALAMGTGIGGTSGAASGAYNKYQELKSIDDTVNEVNEAKPQRERPTRETKINDSWSRLEAKGEELRKQREAQEAAAEAPPVEEVAEEVTTEEAVPPVKQGRKAKVAPVVEEAVVEEAPAEEAPPVKKGELNAATLTSLGLNKNSNAYKELLGVDASTPEGLAFLDETLDSHTGKINETAVGDFIRSIAPQVQEVQDATTGSKTRKRTDRTGVQTYDERQGDVTTDGAEADLDGTMGGTRDNAGQPAGGAESGTDTLASLQVGETAVVGGKVYRKTETGFELVEAEAPEATEVIDEEAMAVEEAPVVEEPLPIEKQGRALAKELRALDPDHPLIDDLTAFDVNEETLALAQQNIDELKAQRGAKGQTTQGELRELSEVPVDEQDIDNFVDKIYGPKEGVPEGEARIKTQDQLENETEEELSRYYDLIQKIREEKQRVKANNEMLGGINMLDDDAKKQYVDRIAELDQNIADVYATIRKTREEFSGASNVTESLLSRDFAAAIALLIKQGHLTEKQAEFYYAIANGDVVTALEYISKYGTNSWYKRIATQLDKAKIFPSISFGNLGDKTLGVFNAETNQVVFDAGHYFQEPMTNGIADLQETFIHELMHAGTVNSVAKAFPFIDNEPTDAEIATLGTDALSYLNSKEFKAAENLIAIFDYLKANHADTFNTNSYYGATNPLEMISEAFANRSFQQYLSTIKLPDELAATGGATNIWQKFVDSVKNLLGINVTNSALQRILENGANAVRKESGKATPLESVGRERFYNKYRTPGNVIANKAKQKADDDLLKRTGTKPTRPPKPLTGAQRFATSPVQTTVDITRKFRSYWASFDQAINDKILAAMRAKGMAQDAIAQAFHVLQVTQAVRADSMADSFLERGDIKYDSNLFKFVITESKQSMKAIRDRLDNLAKKKGIKPEKLYAYATAAFIARRSRGLKNANARLQRRVVQLVAQGKKAQAKKLYQKNYKLVHMTQSEIDAGLEFFKRYPEFNKIFDTWNDVREKVLDFAMDQGLFDQETRDQLLEVMDYVPFFRVEQLEAKAGPKEYSQGLIDTMNTVRGMKGSNQEVNDVFDNMERWIKYTIRKGVQNRAAQEKIKLYTQELPDDIKVLPKGKRSESGNTVSVWQNGKLKRYEFQGMDGDTMVHGFTGMEPAVIPAMRYWNKFANFLRLNIVLQPVFSVAQIPQDAFNAWFSSGVKYPFMLPLQVMKEIALTPVGLSSARKRLKQTVTVGKHDFSREYERIDLDAQEEAKKFKTVDKLIKAILSPLTALSMASDNVIRQAVYSQLMLETGNEANAINVADEIINFRRTGYGQLVNIMRQAAPFVNANLQALHISLATITGNGINPMTRKQALLRFVNAGGQLMALSLIYTVLMSDEDEYKKLDPSERDRNFVFPNGFKLPLRNDLFTAFFKVLPEHIFNRYIDETEDSTKMRKALATAFKRALTIPGGMPSVLSGAVESYMNIDTVTGRPIVGQGQQGLAPELQISPKRTPQLARLLGELGGVSPLHVDHLLQRYFSTMYGMTTMLTNSIIADMRGEVLPTKTAREMALEFPFVSSFLTREHGARNMMDYYELQDIVNEAYKSFNNKQAYDNASVQNYLNIDNNRQLVLMEKSLKNLSDELANLRNYETTLLLDKTGKWNADEKRAEMERIEQERQNMLGFQIELNDRKERYIQQLRYLGGL